MKMQVHPMHLQQNIYDLLCKDVFAREHLTCPYAPFDTFFSVFMKLWVRKSQSTECFAYMTTHMQKALLKTMSLCLWFCQYWKPLEMKYSLKQFYCVLNYGKYLVRMERSPFLAPSWGPGRGPWWGFHSHILYSSIPTTQRTGWYLSQF